MSFKSFSTFAKAPRRAFTLIELLTVVAIIGLLATILIPAVGSAKTSAKKAQSRSLFNGLSTALVNYQSDYGYYPNIGTIRSGTAATTLTTGTNGAGSGNSQELVVALSGRNLPGGGGGNLDTLNPRRSPYYSFAESEFFRNTSGVVQDGVLADGFNNPVIRVIVDADGDGRVTLPSSNAPASHGLDSNRVYRGKVMIWTLAEPSIGSVDVMSWN